MRCTSTRTAQAPAATRRAGAWHSRAACSRWPSRAPRPRRSSPGAPWPAIAVADQHERPWRVQPGTRLVLFAADKAASDLVVETLGADAAAQAGRAARGLSRRHPRDAVAGDADVRAAGAARAAVPGRPRRARRHWPPTCRGAVPR
ncbi:MAG: hypothetical protein MZW92_30165 [Comamonadaceae bacterium]|nr:hypothetical protein [Comamonadaceae bacterium]